jgi:hypothetical protein
VFKPEEGPLTVQSPPHSYVVELKGLLSGPLMATLGNGEVFQGSWHFVGHAEEAAVHAPGAPAPPDLISAWDHVYGPGYFNAHVQRSPRYARALLTGSAGDTAVVEAVNENNVCGQTRGVASDSRNNLYKVSFYNECQLNGLVAGQPWSGPHGFLGFHVLPPSAQGSPASAPPPASPSAPDTSPRLVIPATGGPPVMAIPVGGSTFQPVTGGPPITGTPVP